MDNNLYLQENSIPLKITHSKVLNTLKTCKKNYNYTAILQVFFRYSLITIYHVVSSKNYGIEIVGLNLFDKKIYG